MERREFVARTGLALAGGTLAAGCANEGNEAERRASAGNRADFGEWEAVRRQFDLSPEKIYMSALLVATHPRPVRTAIDRYPREIDANPIVYLDVSERTHSLAGRLKDCLAELAHVHLVIPRDNALSAGIVCFDVDGRSPSEVVAHLAQRTIVATVTPYATSYARLTPSIYNSPDELNTVLQEIQALG